MQTAEPTPSSAGCGAADRAGFWIKAIKAGALAIMVTALAACSATTRPDPEHYQRVRQQVLDAHAAGLSDAAPVEMRFVQQKLAAAELAMQHGDHRQAETLLKDIEVELETARLRARVNRLNRALEAAKRRNAQAEQQLNELQEALHE